METLLTGERLAAEKAFVRSHLESLQKLKCKYPPEYSLPPEKRARRAPIAQIPLQPPPEPLSEDTTAEKKVLVEIKCSKPTLSYSLSCPSTSTIAALKQLLIDSYSAKEVPAIEDQRWLVKGKVLSDTKLLKEYDLKDGDKVTLMLKPGAIFPSHEADIDSDRTESGADTAEAPIAPPPTLKLNLSNLPPNEELGPIHEPQDSSNKDIITALANPEFWIKTLNGLKENLGNESAARVVWEEWFGASKVWLTPSLVAKIREECGVLAMGGT